MKYLAIALSSTLLAACGGGGSSGTAGTAGTASTDSTAVAPQPSTPTAVLTVANQNLAAQDTSSSSFMPMLATQTLTGAQSTDESVLFSVVREQMDQIGNYLANAKSNNSLVGAVETRTQACPNGGSLSVTGIDADNNNMASAGDSIQITSNNCAMGAGKLTGSLGFVINSASGEFMSSNYSAAMSITFGNFTVTTSQLSATANGSMNFSVTANGYNSSSARITTPSLSVSGTYAGVARTRTLSNYNAAFTRSPSSSGYLTSYTLEGYLSSSSFSSQAISFTTPTPLVARNSETYPSSGVLMITGANNSKIRLTPITNAQVRQELDANGDGTYESTSNVSWNSLM